MKRLLGIILLAVMVLPSMSVSADNDLLASSVGVVQVVDNNVDVTYTGTNFKDAKGVTQYQYTARISQAPIYNDDGSKVDCSWYLNKDGTYSIVDNVFTATVTGLAISTTYQGQTMSWNPVVWVDSIEYTSKEPTLLAVDPINENYRENTLEWDYGVCVRRVRVIEGLIQETWIFDKDPMGTVWIKDNATKTVGFTWAIEPYAYDANDNPIVINEYKQVMASEFEKAVYPVTIDPTEVFVTSASDGHIRGAWVSTTGTVDAVSNYFEIGYVTYFYRSFVFFDTSALPDSASITSAILSLYGSYDNSLVDFNVSIQYGVVAGQDHYPHDPLVVGDFDKTHYGATVGGSINTSAGWSTVGYNNISLNATGLSWIDKTGTTKLALRSSIDINSGTTTTTWVKAYSYEKAGGYRPTLYVTYTSSAAPTVVTYSPATSITETSAVCNGSVTDNGSNVITEYGICYGLFANPDTSGTHNSTAADKLGNFSFILTPLTAGQTYYYRAFATNNVSTSYGAEYTFLTSPNASIVTTNPATAITPSQARLNGYLNSGGGETCQVRFQYAYYNGSAWVGNTSTANQSKVAGESFIEDLTGLTVNTQYTFRAESINTYGQTNGAWLLFNTSTSSASLGNPTASCYSGSNTIDLYWVKGANSSTTYIRWKIGAYPSDVYDGTLIPLQYDVDYTHTGLLSGTSYYYRIWGYDAGNVSTTNTTTMCTTTAGSTSSTPAPLPTLNPAGATTAPNGSALTTNPLYPLGILEADAINVPYGTWWMLVGMGGLVVTGLFIYTRSRNLLAALGAMIIFGVIMSQMGIFPIWIMYVFGLAGIGMSWKELR